MTKRSSITTPPVSSRSLTRPAVSERQSARRRFSRRSQFRPTRNYIFVSRMRHPYSWLVPYTNFPSTAEVWDRKGTVVKKIADLPMADTVPNGGVLPGPRSFQWQPLAPATLVWVEALDNGDPKNKVPHRDQVLTLAAPFTAHSRGVRQDRISIRRPVLHRLRRRAAERKRSHAPLDAHLDHRQARRRATQALGSQPGRCLRQPRHAAAPRAALRGRRRFGRTATASISPAPAQVRRAHGRSSIASTSRRSRRSGSFQTTGRTYETVIGVLNDDGSKILTRYESRNDPPNVFVRDLKTGERRALTNYQDPAPQLKGIQKQLVTYKRKDGVELSATIITPPGWTPAQGPLPTLLWAYPREFVDPNMASQVTGSAERYTSISGASHLLFLTQGYAIIDDPTMPIVGPGRRRTTPTSSSWSPARRRRSIVRCRSASPIATASSSAATATAAS